MKNAGVVTFSDVKVSGIGNAGLLLAFIANLSIQDLAVFLTQGEGFVLVNDGCTTGNWGLSHVKLKNTDGPGIVAVQP